MKNPIALYIGCSCIFLSSLVFLTYFSFLFTSQIKQEKFKTFLFALGCLWCGYVISIGCLGSAYHAPSFQIDFWEAYYPIFITGVIGIGPLVFLIKDARRSFSCTVSDGFRDTVDVYSDSWGNKYAVKNNDGLVTGCFFFMFLFALYITIAGAFAPFTYIGFLFLTIRSLKKNSIFTEGLLMLMLVPIILSIICTFYGHNFLNSVYHWK